MDVSIRAPVRGRPPTCNLLAGNVKDTGLREPELPMLRGELAGGAWLEKFNDVRELGALRTLPGLRGRLGFARPVCCGSDDERAVEIGGRFRSMMLDAPFPVRSEHVEAQAVFAFLELRQEPRAELRPLRWIDVALEHRELHPLPVVQAGLGDTPQSPPAGQRLRIHIVGYEHQHVYLHT